MFNNSVFLKHGICDTVTVFLMLLPSLWIQEWAIGKGLYLLAQTTLQLLNASVQDCTWHCALWTVTFQKRISLKHVGLWSSVSSHLPSGSMRAQQRWWSQPGTGDVGAPHVSRWAPALGLMCYGLRQNWVFPLGMWMELEDHILCCSPRRGTENLLLNSASLYNWF